VFFQPGARIEAAVAQLTSVTQTILRVLPPGITPPLIIQYSASNVPILQIGVSSQTLVVMSFAGQTLNVMTLGGLALAVGILVDDATVEIENVHRNLAQGKPLIRAILDGAQQIATQAFVSTLSICIVFVSVVFLTGAVQSLSTPLAMAVVVAMMAASYLLSRTLIPSLVRYLLHSEVRCTSMLTAIMARHRRVSSGICTIGSIGDLNDFAAATATPSPGPYSIEPRSSGWRPHFLGGRWC
jgi:multidrug efflux pump subunit AcrB